MKIKAMIKKIPGVLYIKKRFEFKKAFRQDYLFFLKNYMYSKKEGTNIEYDILLLVHSLEKAMTSKHLRFFGIEKVDKLKTLLKELQMLTNENNYAFITGINCLRSYCSFYEKQFWQERQEYIDTKNYLLEYQYVENIPVGVQQISNEEFLANNKDFASLLYSRHSIREYSSKEIEEDVIKEAIKLASLSPSACNRQMCKIYNINNQKSREVVAKYGQGFSHFDLDNAHYFLVTFDISANSFIGERNQGWFNAGLMAMNFINALHSMGIGSCFIQFGNNFNEEQTIKKKLLIPQSERIAVIISAGYYPEKTIIPISHRKDIADIYCER